MKALFVDYFNVSAACCLLILLVILFRFALKGVPKAMICVMWMLVFLRLALPFGLENNLSLRPSLPIVTEESTGLYFESELIPEGQIPDYIPRARASFSFGDWTARIDYVMIAARVWGIGFALILLHTVISYAMLRFKLRGAIHLRDNIYISSCNGGFLLGYVHPRIYLPACMDEKTADIVITHERAHQMRGDNWLKLFAYLCVGLHWYNPLAWIAYMLLCVDIEYACDERVVKTLELEDRKTYSAALLSVGKKRKRLTGGLLPFGESNLRRRIITVLNYRKPAMWICVVAAVAIVLFGVFFVTDPVPEHPPLYKQLIELVGQPKETVVRELETELLETEESAMSGFYNTPIKVEYKGVEFDLVLGFSLVDDRLWGFQYVAIYNDNVGQAAADTVTIAKQLQRTYGRASQHGNKRTLWLSEIDVESVLEKFENRYLSHEGIDMVGGNWQLSEAVGRQTRDYWEQLVRSEFWQKQWEGKNIELSFGLDLMAWDDPDSDKTYLCLDYDTKYSFGTVAQYDNASRLFR